MFMKQILAIAPIKSPQLQIASQFQGAENRFAGLANAYQVLCQELNCHFFDAAFVTTSSKVDGVHFDIDQHLISGEAIIAFNQLERL